MARFTFISSFLLSFVLLIAVSPFFVKAQTTCETGNPNEVCVTVGNAGGAASGSGAENATPTEPGDYLSNLYNFLLGLVGVAAMGSIVYGGVLYIISAGNPSRVGTAKQAIWNGIAGILVAGFGYLILSTINTDLVGGFDLQSIVTKNLNKIQQ
ncbi:MAG: hypothetical protein Q7R73_01440 [bacterium]|nr:hypothetical protein [bacterium]